MKHYYTPSEIKDLLEFDLTMDQEEIKRAVLIVGKRGSGKSTVVRELAKEKNYGFIDVRLGNLADTSELLGMNLPVKEGDYYYTVKTVPNLIHKLTELSKKHEKVVLFFDEATQTPPHIQKVLMGLITERELDGFKIPSSTHIILAGNELDEGTFLYALEKPVLDRLTILFIKNELNEWLDNYALDKEIHPAIVSYLRFNPGAYMAETVINDFERYSSPRTFEALSKRIKVIEKNATDREKMLKAVRMYAVGDLGKIGEDFMNYYTEIHSKKLMDVMKSIGNVRFEEFIRQKTSTGFQGYITPEAVAELKPSEAYMFIYSTILNVYSKPSFKEKLKHFVLLSEMHSKISGTVSKELLNTTISKAFDYYLGSTHNLKGNEISSLNQEYKQITQVIENIKNTVASAGSIERLSSSLESFDAITTQDVYNRHTAMLFTAMMAKTLASLYPQTPLYEEIKSVLQDTVKTLDRFEELNRKYSLGVSL